MSNIKVHDHHSLGSSVPFSWENKPGVCKETHPNYNSPTDIGHLPGKLPPPPCPQETPRASFHDLQVPLPPCAFQPPSRSSSRRGFRKKDDPFLTAYKECTKSTSKGKLPSVSKDDGRFGLKKNLSILSCKNSFSVMDDSIVRMSELPDNVKSLRRKERS